MEHLKLLFFPFVFFFLKFMLGASYGRQDSYVFMEPLTPLVYFGNFPIFDI